MIESTNANTKVRVSVGWVAPNGGCVLIKAAVLQHRSVWYIDDGFLTKRICAEEIDEVNSQTPALDVCCACDEAKYEVGGGVKKYKQANSKLHESKINSDKAR